VTTEPNQGSIHALSGAYVVDAVDDAERAAFEEHLDECPDCRAEVLGLREATAVLAGISTVRPLPPETSDTSAPTATESPVVVPLRRRRSFRIASLAAAAAVLAAIGFGAVWQPWQDTRSPSVATLSAADRVLAADDAKHVKIDFPDGSSATVVRSRSEGRAVLVTKGMAAPPSGKVFEVWLPDDTGRMSPAGLMSRAGENKVLLKGDASAATGVGITVEPEGGSDQPTSAPIALFELDKASA
jgi:anti-sigma-K factor RskA